MCDNNRDQWWLGKYRFWPPSRHMCGLLGGDFGLNSNHVSGGGVPFYLKSRDSTQVPWRQELPSFISLMYLFLSNHGLGCGGVGCSVERDGVTVMCAVLLTERGVKHEGSAAKANPGVMFLEPGHAENYVVGRGS